MWSLGHISQLLTIYSEGSDTVHSSVRDFEIHRISSGFLDFTWISYGFLDFTWISGFHLDFKWISGFHVDFLISSGFHRISLGFLQSELFYAEL